MSAPRPIAPTDPALDAGPDFAALDALVTCAFPGAGEPRGGLAWEAMPGGASTRRYFRGRVPAGTVVGMYVPDGAKPDEVGKAAGAPVRWPFLEVRDLLASRGVDVPRVLGEDTARGWVLLEDLGDDTLAAFLAAHPARKEELYVRAVGDLAQAQQALSNLGPGSVVASRAFDEDLLLWEIHHFREWALEARGITLSPGDRATFDAVARRLATRIAAGPRVFVHRDYQSRNLMVRRDSDDMVRRDRDDGEWSSLCWIDFQDALLGPRVYDLVALLNDSYQTFDRPFIEARLDEYVRAARLGADARGDIGREFDRVTVQRKLKDAGRFVFIDRVKKNGSFLKFVEPTIAKARASLGRLGDDEDMRALGDLLARVLPV
jgi:aminoglycoside/choline kinase family phosphotransferase